MRTAVYAGSFDPVTRGHEDIIHRAASMFDHLIVAIGVNSTKRSTFTVEQRERMLREIEGFPPNASVAFFSGLLAVYCQDVQARPYGF
jgi:pantetheine-phosphate adenylyltransferase